MQRDEGLKGTEVNSEFTLEIQEHSIHGQPL